MFGDLSEEVKLVFKRQSHSSGYGVGGLPQKQKRREIPATGSLQPFSTDTSMVREGNVRRLAQRGYSSKDSYIFFSDTKLRGDDEFDKTVADTTVINNRKYYVWAVKNWALFGTDLDHYEVVLVRKELEGVDPTEDDC